MSNKKYIFVDFPVSGYLYGTEISEVSVRRHLSKPLRFLRKFPVFSSIISNTKERKGWIEDCKQADVIIIFDTFARYSTYCNEIEGLVDKDIRLVLYLLNPAFFSEDYKKVSPRWEKWTFSKSDADKLGFKYGATFYNAMLLSENVPHCSEGKAVDVLFVGTDKGRKPFVLDLKRRLAACGVRCDFRVVDNFKSLFSSEYSREVSYRALCGMIQRSKVLLDVVQEGQYGLTLRIMEALLFGKKIITTNKYINNDSDFVGNENIYVLDKDNINGLQAFILKPFVPYADELRKKYSFTEWLRRIEDGQEMK